MKSTGTIQPWPAPEQAAPRLGAGVASSRYEIDLVRTDAEFQALRPEWQALYRESAPCNPFLSFEWVAACREHLCPGAPLFVLTARENGRLVGVAALRVDRLLGFRVLRFIGKGVSPYVAFLHSPEHPEVEQELLGALARYRDDWDLLLLTQLGEPFTRLHLVALPDGVRGFTGDLAWKGSSYCVLDADWETVEEAGPTWLKSAPKRVRRFERDGGTIERHVGLTAVDHVDEALWVESQSWQGKYGRPLASPDRLRALLRKAFAELGGRGEMELWLARMNDMPIAYELNFMSPERIWMFRGAYHEAYGKQGPGTILDFLSIRTAWDEGRREYDYLSGGESYKALRTNAVRPMKRLSLYPVTPRGLLAYAMLLAPRCLLERFEPTRAAFRSLLRLRGCVKAAVPGSGAKRSRVH